MFLLNFFIDDKINKRLSFAISDPSHGEVIVLHHFFFKNFAASKQTL